ncbi:MAG: TonB family protein [Candidatus Deianiraeaceae bacterium]|jgi:TonB family protein
MYSASQLKYDYSQRKIIVITTGINIIILLLLLKVNSSSPSVNFSQPKAQKQGRISIQKYKIITQSLSDNNTNDTSKAKTPYKDQKNTKTKNVNEENITPTHTTSQTKQIIPDRQKDINALSGENKNDTPVTEPSHFGLNNSPPRYPIISFQLGEYGAVILEYSVAKNGTILSVKVAKSSGYTRLDKVALIGLRKWIFKPSVNFAGQPVDSNLKQITFVFNIKTEQIQIKR